MVLSENLRRSRLLQGDQGYKGGHLGDCEEAKNKGRQLGGSNSAPRNEPGRRVAWLPVKANLQI